MRVWTAARAAAHQLRGQVGRAARRRRRPPRHRQGRHDDGALARFPRRSMSWAAAATSSSSACTTARRGRGRPARLAAGHAVRRTARLTDLWGDAARMMTRGASSSDQLTSLSPLVNGSPDLHSRRGYYVVPDGRPSRPTTPACATSRGPGTIQPSSARGSPRRRRRRARDGGATRATYLLNDRGPAGPAAAGEDGGVGVLVRGRRGARGLAAARARVREAAARAVGGGPGTDFGVAGRATWAGRRRRTGGGGRRGRRDGATTAAQVMTASLRRRASSSRPCGARRGRWGRRSAEARRAVARARGTACWARRRSRGVANGITASRIAVSRRPQPIQRRRG